MSRVATTWAISLATLGFLLASPAQADDDTEDEDGEDEASSGSSGEWTRYPALVGLDYMPIGNGMHGFHVGPRFLYRRGDGRITEGGARSMLPSAYRESP